MQETIKAGYTRVTEPLALFNNFDHIPPDVLQNAADRGTRVHRYCELHARGDYFPTVDRSIQGYIDGYCRWHDEMVDKTLFIEQRLYNDLYRITGQIDEVAILKGDTTPTVIDWKTPIVASKSWALQTAAYQFLVDGFEGLKPTRRIALQLFKDGKYPKVIEYTDYENDWGIYKGILKAMRFFND